MYIYMYIHDIFLLQADIFFLKYEFVYTKVYIY